MSFHSLVVKASRGGALMCRAITEAAGFVRSMNASEARAPPGLRKTQPRFLTTILAVMTLPNGRASDTMIATCFHYPSNVRLSFNQYRI